MNRIVWIIWMASLPFSTLLEARPALLILRLKAEDGASITRADSLGDSVRIYLSRSNAFDLLEILSTNESECAEANCAVSLAKEQVASYVLIGTIAGTENEELSLFLYRTDSRQLIFADQISLSSGAPDTSEAKVKSLIEHMVGRVRGKPEPDQRLGRDPDESYSILYQGLRYPGLGHLKLKNTWSGAFYATVFTLTLYNAAIRTPQVNRARRSDRNADLNAAILTTLLLPNGRTAFGSNSQVGLVFVASAYDAKKRNAPAARARTRYSLLLMTGVYALSIVDLATFRLNLLALPGKNDSSYGLALTYRF